MPALPSWLLCWRAADDSMVTFEDTRYLARQGVMLAQDARRGQITSVPYPVMWSQAIPSWRANTPDATAISVLLRANVAGRWTRWYALGEWSSDANLRRSIPGQADGDAEVATDTLLLRQPGQAVQWRVVLHGRDTSSPVLHTMALALDPMPISDPDAMAPETIQPLPVPELSQMVYPNGGSGWCSPTSLTMLLAYWFAQTRAPQLAPFTDPQAVPQVVAPAVYDAVYGGTGNWPFNTAYAANLGLEGYVMQFRALTDLVPWLAAGVPVVASIGWQPGELDGAPVGHSNGHLVVVVGIAPNGDVIVNDPAADPRRGESVRRVYPRHQFCKAWQRSGRTVYLVYPPEYAS